MIKFFVNVVQSIIIAMIFIIIIEMLLPNNSNKKYVKMVAGIYMVFTILNPFLKLSNNEFSLDFFENLETLETSSTINNNDLKNYYINSLDSAIKNNLKNKGYRFSNLKIELNDDYSEIVKIEIKGANLNDLDDIKNFLLENYEVKLENIIFS